MAEYAHFGTPPPGTAFIELVSQSSSAPLQFAGTADPPTVLLNGKPLMLEQLDSGPTGYGGEGPALWINDIDRKVSGTAGRFFVQIGGKESAVASLDVLIRTGTGAFHRATAAVNRIFLDTQIRQVLSIAEEKAGAARYLFKFSGQIPEGFTLTSDDGKISVSGDETVFEPELPVGASTITAKLQSPGGSVRVLNLPVNVSKKLFKPDAHMLEVDIPGGNEITAAAWKIPANGFVLGGYTNPGAGLEINGAPVKTGGSGNFSMFMQKDEKEWDLHFKVTLPGPGEKTWTQNVICPDCRADRKWYDPKFREGGKTGVSISLADITWLAPRSAAAKGPWGAYAVSPRSQPVTPLAAAGVMYHLDHRFSAEFTGRYSILRLKGENLTRSMSISQLMVFTLGMNYQPVPVFFAGAGMAMIKANVEPSGFIQSIKGGNDNLGVYAAAGLRITLWRAVDASLKLTIIPAQSSIALSNAGLKWHLFSIETLVLRWYF
ncbi:MAG: hypothetical protein A2583_06990 [Bdellovibrionales bacterium RIFOXYD1_FULL_53_11]|nr:MAG: hypothetical protein A2583_06990 [Bdellovibrionales bacterium RIFOXYD1_FULL_53_11]